MSALAISSVIPKRPRDVRFVSSASTIARGRLLVAVGWIATRLVILLSLVLVATGLVGT